jgi:hypothetical protein
MVKLYKNTGLAYENKHEVKQRAALHQEDHD